MMTNLVTMPGVDISPETLLHQAIDGLEEYNIKSVFLIQIDSEDVISFGWSTMCISDMALAAILMQRKIGEIAEELL